LLKNVTLAIAKDLKGAVVTNHQVVHLEVRLLITLLIITLPIILNPTVLRVLDSVLRVHRDQPELLDQRDHQGKMVQMVPMVFQEQQDPKVHLDHQVQMEEQQDPKVLQE
jgi:hypothetical protein